MEVLHVAKKPEIVRPAEVTHIDVRLTIYRAMVNALGLPLTGFNGGSQYLAIVPNSSCVGPNGFATIAPGVGKPIITEIGSILTKYTPDEARAKIEADAREIANLREKNDAQRRIIEEFDEAVTKVKGILEWVGSPRC